MELWNFDKGKVIYDLSWSRDNEVVKKVLWIQIFNIYLDISIKFVEMNWFIKMYDLWKKERKNNGIVVVCE